MNVNARKSCRNRHARFNYLRSIIYFCSVQRFNRQTAALFHALDALLLGGRLLIRTAQSQRHGGEPLGLAKGAGLEGALLPTHVPRDVEGVALSVAEPVDDGPADAALLVDGLLERLRLAPVPLQVAALRDVQSLLAGLQHLLPRRRLQRRRRRRRTRRRRTPASAGNRSPPAAPVAAVAVEAAVAAAAAPTRWGCICPGGGWRPASRGCAWRPRGRRRSCSPR